MAPFLAIVLAASLLHPLFQGKREPIAPPPAPAVVPAAGSSQAPAKEPEIRGRLLDEWGAPLAGWIVRASRSRPSLFRAFQGGQLRRDSWDQETVADDQGRFRLERMPAFALVLEAPDESLAVLREDFRLDAGEIVLRLRPEDRPTAFIEGFLSIPPGFSLGGAAAMETNASVPSGPPPSPSISTFSADGFECAYADVSPGHFRLGPLRPGEHIVTAAFEGLAPLRLVVRLDEHATLDLGTLSLGLPGFVVVQLEDPEIPFAPLDVVSTLLFREEAGRMRRYGSVRNGPAAGVLSPGLCSLGSSIPLPPVGHSYPLAPGRYLLRTRGERWFAPDAVVEVTPGRTTVVPLRLESARDLLTARTLRLSLPPGDPSTHLDLRVRDSRGSTIWDDEILYRTDDRPFVAIVDGLMRGDYTLEARSPTGRSVQARFEIVQLEPEGDLEFELR